MCVRDVGANCSSDDNKVKQTNKKQNTIKHQEREDGEKYQHPEEKKEFKTNHRGGNAGGLGLVKGLDIIS